MNKTKHFLILYLIIVILSIGIGFLFFKEPEKKWITIEIPPKEGSFAPWVATPVEKAKDSIVYEEVKIYIENEVNKELAEKYAKAIYEKDSIEQAALYLSAIQIRHYEKTFEDDNIKLSFDIETTGFLNSVTPSYTVKGYSLPIEIDDPVRNSLYGGIYVSNTLTLDRFAIGGQLGFKNRKENIMLFGYDTQENITFTYLTKFFNF